MSRAFMPFYDGDWMRDTAHLDDHQERAYFRLVMFYWAAEKLPTDERQLARIARMTPAKWRKNRELLAAFFDENWKHKRVEKELEKNRKFIEKQRQNGAKPKAKTEPNTNPRARIPQPQPDMILTDHISSSLRSESPEPAPASRTKPNRKEKIRPELFQKFYDAFPRHVGPDAALKAFERAVAKGADPLAIIAGAERFRAASAGKDQEFLPHPATWLNAGRWKDGQAQAPPTQQSESNRLKRLREQMEEYKKREMEDGRLSKQPELLRNYAAPHQGAPGGLRGDTQGEPLQNGRGASLRLASG